MQLHVRDERAGETTAMMPSKGGYLGSGSSASFSCSRTSGKHPVCPSAMGKGKLSGQRPGTSKLGRPPKVGFFTETEFCCSFKRLVKKSPRSPLKIPAMFRDQIRGKLPQKIVLGNTAGNSRSVYLVEYKDRVYIDDGWADFAEANDIAKGDTLIFTQYGGLPTGGSPMRVAIFSATGWEKTLPHPNAILQ